MPDQPGTEVFRSREDDASDVEGVVCEPVVKPWKFSASTIVWPLEVNTDINSKTNPVGICSDFFIKMFLSRGGTF